MAAAVFVAGMLVGADSMSRAVGVPTYIADVIVAVSLIVDAGGDDARALPAALALSDAGDDPRPAARQRRFWVAVLRIATPLIFGTLGVLLCERAGVLNLGIEGIMVAGAFTGWLAVYQGAALWTGVLRRRADRRGVRPAARAPDGAARRCRSTCPGSASRCSRRASRTTPTA